MNLTERELLELVAKAAGLNNARYYPEEDGLVSCIEYDDENDCRVVWMPHLDDGDALRLAVECGINPIQCVDSVDAMHFNSCIVETEMFEDNNGDKCAATRRAIVRAAAAIQLSKEGK